MKTKHKLAFPILSDPGNAYAKELRLVHTLPHDLRSLYRNFGIRLPDFNGDVAWALPLATRIVVKPDGTVHTIHADADYTKRPEVEVTLEELRAL